MAKSSLPSLRSQQSSAASQRMSLQQARARTRRLPWEPNGWKELGRLLRKAGELDEAREAAQKAADLAPEDSGAWVLLGQVEAGSGNDRLARMHFQHALTLDNDAVDAHQGMADLLFRSNDNGAVLTHADRVLERKPDDVSALSRKAQALTRLRRFDQAAVICHKLIQQDARNGSTHWNDLGNIKRDLGDLTEAEACYRKAASLTTSDPVPLSNRLTLLHYMPEQSAEDILKACKEWSARFAPAKAGKRPVAADLSPARPLRVGMYSDGFRQHPVGAMTTPALEHLVKLGIEIYAYTTSNVVDSVTRRLMKIAKQWTPIATLTVEQLAQRVMDDRIDILIDLSGHNAGNRIRTMTLHPAPVQVKWVGGLINTTGVEAIDYLLSDAIESPPGSDHFYTEKLIRMPDDYICYMPPARVPDVGALPALRNGYVSFGCFNNPTKINEVLLREWARLLSAVPGSRLFLKGGSYESTEVCDRIRGIFASHGIAGERIRLEGHSPHYELFECYNEVDVALDPWPYSGGLTTCEAMLMGVPVVTLPGPTFAGRHSATHLVNAGMPELVARDWDEYRQRALELVGDLDSLGTIRAHLREILLQSPVCDAPRFARNLANALRAIWQRYCEGKPPAALSFTADATPWFEGDDAPMVLTHPEPDPEQGDGSFNFAFQGKVVTLHHGGTSLGGKRFADLSRLGALQSIAIDPAGQVQDPERLKLQGQLQHYHAQIALGDGQPAVVYACLDASLTGTLEPLAASEQPGFARQGASVLAKLPVATARLDGIDGLERLDWLILDAAHDNPSILDGAQRLLREALAVQVGVLFAKVYARQPDLADISARLTGLGLRLLRLDNASYRSHFPAALAPHVDHGGSQLFSADAVFVPDAARLKTLDNNRRLKLAFILHAAYGATDMAHQVLDLVDTEKAMRFLTAGGWLKDPAATEPTQPAAPSRASTDPTTRAGIIEAPALLRSRTTPRPAYVGIPVYNEEKYIEETIRSLKEQDTDAVGFLVCDNASTDRTLEIVRDTAGSDTRFEIFRQTENRGAYTNFKFAYENTDSEYFMWLGGHDYLSPDYLRRCIEALETDPELSMAFGMPYSVQDGTVNFLKSGVYDFSHAVPAQRYMQSVSQLANCVIVHSLFRRKHLADFEMREVISGDHVFISHLLWKGLLRYVDGPKYFRRYFQTRSDTAAERITGKKQELSRADFYRYYQDNFDVLSKGVLKPAEANRLRAMMKDILLKRFGG
jgi:predicted O-linked N-acetylglucosamine transferase (SPINDLY family)